MTQPSSRRTLLCVLVALPTLTVPAVAIPAPSGLASACDWAVQHSRWINASAGIVEPWTDDKMAEETGRYWEVFDRVAEQPSGGIHDIQDKARLALNDMADAGELEGANPGVDLATSVLKEIIALRA